MGFARTVPEDSGPLDVTEAAILADEKRLGMDHDSHVAQAMVDRKNGLPREIAARIHGEKIIYDIERDSGPWPRKGA